MIHEQIQEKLLRFFSPTHFELHNESHMHNVPEGSESHFRLLMVSARFDGLNRVSRQRQVNELLKDELAGPVHAFSQMLLTPAEWEAKGGQVNMKSPDCLGGSNKDKAK